LPHPQDLALLEARALELETLPPVEASARRRVLLVELEVAGLFDPDVGVQIVLGNALAAADWHAGECRRRYPLLLAYHDAARALLAYLLSDVRARRQPTAVAAARRDPRVRGAPVSLDWFRRPTPHPPELDRLDWLAVAERHLAAARVTPTGGGGEVFLRAAGAWWVLEWRTDDGVTPALVGSRKA
jgi:hypothetical protein